MSQEQNGFEYMVVGSCPRTGKYVVAPRAWSSKVAPRPYYGTCMCYPKCQKKEK